MERVADCVIRKVQEAGANHIFMVTGRGILYLSDAVAKNENLKSVSTLHEQGASYAAMAYAHAKDGISACLVSTGCAATNAVTSCLCAYQDNLPCVFISGQNMLNETTRFTKQPIRTFGSQEADIIKIVESITKYSVMLTDANEAAYHIEKALHLATTGRKGPVWIDIPLDIQNARIEESELEHFSVEKMENKISADDINSVIQEFKNAKRPIVFIGGGVRCANAESEIKEFVEKNKIPLVSSESGCDIYGSGNEFSIGVVGSLGCSRAGNFAVQNSDFILAIGTKLCTQTVGDDKNTFAREAKIFVVDIDENEHKKKGVKIEKIINCDAKNFLQELNEIDFNCNYADWTEKCLHWKDVFSLKNEDFIKQLTPDSKADLYYIADSLSEKLTDDSTVITDAGLEELIFPSAIKYKNEQRCLFPAAQGAMGYAIPAILGAHFAGRKNIICIVGDGSVMMNIQELQVIRYHNINAKILVVNNDMYAVIRKRQKDLFRARTIGNDPSDGVPASDFKKIAESYGFEYMRADNISEFDSKIDGFLNSSSPVIFEVVSNPEQKYFHASYAFNSKKRFVKRPIEDLSPFIDRELFQKEMVVKPIDE